MRAYITGGTAKRNMNENANENGAIVSARVFFYLFCFYLYTVYLHGYRLPNRHCHIFLSKTNLNWKMNGVELNGSRSRQRWSVSFQFWKSERGDAMNFRWFMVNLYWIELVNRSGRTTSMNCRLICEISSGQWWMRKVDRDLMNESNVQL